MPHDDQPESALVSRAVLRDREAFGQLYSLYFDRIFRYVWLKVGNITDAEDLTAVVFLSAWRGIDHFSPKHETSFAGWLFRLAHNAVVDRYRRAQDSIPLDSVAVEPLNGREDSDPEAEIERRLTLAELRQALYTLTEEQREVVQLRFIEGLSAREVGDIMGKQEGTVRGMQYRAIEALRRALAVVREVRQRER